MLSLWTPLLNASISGVVTSSPSPDQGIFALSQMDPSDEQLDLPTDTKLTTLPTPHPQGVASLGSSSLVSSADDMHSPQHCLEASQARTCSGVLILAPHEAPQPCAWESITHHINVAVSAPSLILPFSSTQDLQAGKAFMGTPPRNLTSPGPTTFDIRRPASS